MGTRWRGRCHAGQLQETIQFFWRQIAPLVAEEAGFEDDVAKAHPHQAADLDAHGLPEAAHLAVAALAEQDVIPAVGATAAGVGLDDLLEARRAVVQFHAMDQALQRFPRRRAEDAHGVFALELLGGVHQLVGQFAVVGQQQQAGGVDVQAADGDPAPL